MANIEERPQFAIQLIMRKQASEDFMSRIYGALENWHAAQQGGDEKRVWITKRAIRAFIERNIDFEDITRDDKMEVSYTASMNSKAVIKVARLGAVGRASVGGGAGGAALGVVSGGGAGAGVGALIGIIGGPIGVAIGAGIGAGVGAATGGVAAIVPGAGAGGLLAYKFAKKVDVKIISLKDHFNAQKFIEQSQRIKITCQFLPQEDA